MKSENRNEKAPGTFGGFTSLIALMIGLSGVSCGDVFFRKRHAKMQAIADLKILDVSLIRYKTNGRRYPTTEQGLEALFSKPAIGPEPAAWERYVEASALIDPWGNPYQYRYPGRVDPEIFNLWSLGPDGKDGTSDDISAGDD